MDKKAKKTNQTSNKINLIIALEAVVILFLGVTVAILAGQPPQIVANFEQCKEVFGSKIVETKTWTRVERACDINGERFYERDMNSQSNENDSQDSTSEEQPRASEFIGLTEEQAMQKAEDSNTPIRVLERDGNPLPATMDLVEGRVNLYIKDGVVKKAIVETGGFVEEDQI